MLPRRMRQALLVAEIVGALTLVRSVAYDRWITVLASVLLLTGVAAARHNRAWGVWLALGAAAAFPVAFAIGIAPLWFCLVGLAGALPFLLASRAFARFDKGATAILAGIAATVGALGAVAWKQVAFTLFDIFPFLRPTIHPHHGLLLAVLAVAGGVALVLRMRAADRAEAAQVRVGAGAETNVRVAAVEEDLLDGEAETAEVRARRRRVLR